MKSTSPCTDRQVRLDISELREERSVGLIKSIHWIPTYAMLADGLTKKGACYRNLCNTLETGKIKDFNEFFNAE